MGASSGVVIVAGPSGSGKSHLAARLGWPVLRLDDFYRDIDAPDMPRSTLGIVDWDHPGSWDAVAAVGTIAELCASGTAEVPVYDIATSRRTGTQTLTVPDGQFIAEGLFAPVIVDACREAGLLEAAICLRRRRTLTFMLRLFRDLREGRKSPQVLVRRGWRLMQEEPRIVAEAVAHGCDPMTPREARELLTA
ncbi:uridine kinase family protein [Aeromicrobium chenweiae]|uniref:ATP-binding protein n=1 Tax=Aeromicrobium chenweiae TaxID=2079793 RepID=A0A2S0WPK1_9ACTN|nr:ATP-binding protein [Aeromicrobium chenweiae]AWB93231.1 ATP-binding protein [Aeromicrobium chenweiae]TGN34223.1 ATP-binding protein [Aeromicrobium chenweiae]